MESFEPKEGSHPCDLSKSSDDEVVDDDETPQEIDEGGTPALLLTPPWNYGSVTGGCITRIVLRGKMHLRPFWLDPRGSGPMVSDFQ